MKKIILLLQFLLPTAVFAQDFNLEGAGVTFKTVVMYVVGIVNAIVPILISIAFIVFFWGLSKFVIGASNDKEVKNGKEFMLWGILALFVLISVRTILGILSNELEFGSQVKTPLLPTSSNSQSQ